VEVAVLHGAKTGRPPWTVEVANSHGEEFGHPGHRRIPVSVELIVVGDFGGALSWVAAPAHPAPAAYIPIRGNKKTAAF